jgi:hypothetical protein
MVVVADRKAASVTHSSSSNSTTAATGMTCTAALLDGTQWEGIWDGCDNRFEKVTDTQLDNHKWSQ